MKLREDKWLEGQAQSWVRSRIITEKQASAILEKTREEAKSNAFNATYLLAALGALCVALGVILVVSFNWEKIHRFVKIPFFLLVLAALAEALHRIPEKSKLGRTAVSVGWLLMPLAGIGLWGQVYQLSGDPLKPLLVWLALGLPLVWKTRNTAVAFLHSAGLAISLFVGAFDHGTWLSIVKHGWRWQGWDGSFGVFIRDFSIPLLGLALLWGYGFFQARSLLKDKGRFCFTLAFLVFLASLQIYNTPFTSRGDSMVFLNLSAILVLYWGLQDYQRIEAGFWRTWGWTCLAALLYTFTFLWHAGHVYDQAAWPAGVLSFSILALGLLGLVGVKDRELASDRAGAWALRILVLMPSVLSYLMLLELTNKGLALLANLSFLVLALWLMREGVALNRPKRINGGVVLLGILVFTRFLDYFGTLFQSGMAFIVIGLFFVGLAFALNRGRRELLARAERKK